MSSYWESLVDKAIRNAMADGKFENLPGAGQPFRWPDEAHTPEDMRLAYKILKENDLAPDWILHQQALDARVKALRTQMRAAHQRCHAPGRPTDQAAALWTAAKAEFTEAIEKLNREITAGNLKLPPGLPHRPLLIPREAFAGAEKA